MANDAPVRDPDEQALVDELGQTRQRANPNMNPQLSNPRGNPPSAPAPQPPQDPKKMSIREHLQALFDHFGYK